MPSSAADFPELLARFQEDAAKAGLPAQELEMVNAMFDLARTVWEELERGEVVDRNGQVIPPLSRGECASMLEFLMQCGLQAGGDDPVRIELDLGDDSRKPVIAFLVAMPLVQQDSRPIFYLATQQAALDQARAFWDSLERYDGYECTFSTWDGVDRKRLRRSWILGDLDWSHTPDAATEQAVEKAIRKLRKSEKANIVLLKGGGTSGLFSPGSSSDSRGASRRDSGGCMLAALTLATVAVACACAVL